MHVAPTISFSSHGDSASWKVGGGLLFMSFEVSPGQCRSECARMGGSKNEGILRGRNERDSCKQNTRGTTGANETDSSKRERNEGQNESMKVCILHTNWAGEAKGRKDRKDHDGLRQTCTGAEQALRRRDCNAAMRLLQRCRGQRS